MTAKSRNTGVGGGIAAGRAGVVGTGLLWARPLGWFWMALAVAALASGGCGGCGKKKAPPRPTGPPGPRQSALADDDTPPDDGAKNKPSVAKGKEPPGVTPKEKPKPDRPEDVSQWKKNDYLSAKAAADPKLVDALEQFGQKFTGNAKAAGMLAELLPLVEEEPEAKPEEKPAPNPAIRPGTRPGMRPEMMPGTRPGMRPGMSGPKTLKLSPEAIRAAVAALVVNRTSEARTILKALLAGTIDTGSDEAATQAVLDELAAQPSPENEEILFQALTSPKTYRPVQPETKPKSTQPGPRPGPRERPGYPSAGRQSATTAEGIRQAALALLKDSASPRFRQRLARHLVDRSTPLPQVELLAPMLKEPRPENLGAQLILYQGTDTSKETRQSILQYFTTCSSDALGLLLGVSVPQASVRSGQPTGYPPRGPTMHPTERPGYPAGRPGYPAGRPRYPTGRPGTMQPEAKPDPDLPYRMAGQVWGPEFAGLIDGRLEQVESLDAQAQVVLLAATIPTDTMRFKLHGLLEKHWMDGPRGLEALGFPGQVVTDPGLLITVKMLPRARAKAASGTTSRPPAHSPGRKQPPAEKSPRETDDREQAEQEWLRISADMVTALCQQFESATLAEVEAARLARRNPDFSAALKGLPLEIQGDPVRGDPAQGDPKLLGAYRLDFPGPLAAKLPGVPLGQMTIHYVRLKTNDRMTKVVSYYRRKVESRRAYESQHGTWLDSCRAGDTDDTKDRQRSIDVLISAAADARQPGVRPGRQPGVQPGRQPGRQPGKQPGKQPARTATGEPEDLIIEILSIEMLDPSRAPGSKPAPKEEKPRKKS